MPLQHVNRIPSAPPNQRVYHFIATPGGTGLTAPGVTLTATGTATAYSVPASGGSFIEMNPVVEVIAAAATNAVAGLRTNYRFMTRFDVGAGGFYLRCRWRPATGMTISTHRAFCGVTGSIAAPTDVDPTSLTNAIGMGWRSGDSSLSIFHGGTAPLNVVPLSSSSFPRPTNDRANLYDFELYAPKGGSVVHWQVTSLTNGAVANGTITSGLPSSNVNFAFQLYASVGGTSSDIGVALGELYVVTGV